MKRSAVSWAQGMLACLLLLLGVYVLRVGPLRIDWGGRQILLVRDFRVLFGICFLAVSLKIIFAGSSAWLRKLLRKRDGWYLLPGLFFLGACYGIGLFAFLQFHTLKAIYTRVGTANANWQDVLEGCVFFSSIASLLFGMLLCRLTEERESALRKCVASLRWGLLFLVLLTPLMKWLSLQVVSMMMVLLWGLTAASMMKAVPQKRMSCSKMLWWIGGITYFVLACLIVAKSRLPRNCDDFPFFIQSLSSMMRGELMTVTWLLDKSGDGISYFGDHFSPILALLLPVWAIWPRPETLLVVQVLLVGVAAIPLYHICKLRFPDKPLVLFAIVFVYLVSPWMQKGLFFDFHQDAFKPVFIFLAFLSLLKKRWWVYWLSIAALLATKEDSLFIPLVFGIYAILFRKNYVVGAISILLAVGYAVVVMGHVMPSFFHDDTYRHVGNRYAHLGESMGEVAKTALLHPISTFQKCFDIDSFHTLIYLLIPVACIALFSLRGLILVVPFVAQMMMSQWHYTRVIYFYYPFAVFPFVVLSVITGMERLSSLSGRWPLIQKRSAAYLIAATCCFAFFHHSHIERNDRWCDYYYLHNAPLGFRFSPSRYCMTPRERVGREFMKEVIPPEASLSAPVRYAAHLARRPMIRMFPNTAGVDYLFADVRGEPYNKYLERERSEVFELLRTGNFGIVEERDGYLLVRRGADSTVNEAFIRKEKWRYEAEMLHRQTGDNRSDPVAENGMARHVDYWSDGHGAAVFGPYVELPEGSYEVDYWIRGWARKPDHEAADLAVTIDRGKTRITELTLKGADLKAKQYSPFKLEFELEEDAVLEFPIFFKGRSELWIDRIELRERAEGGIRK